MFPVLCLPLVAFENVYRHWKITEIIHLSQCSKRTKAVIRSMEKHRASVLEVNIDRTQASVTVMSGKRILFRWIVFWGRRTLFPAQAHDFVFTIVEPQPPTPKIPPYLIRRRTAGIEQDVLVVVQALQDVLRSPIAKIFFTSSKVMCFDKLFRSSSILHTASHFKILADISSVDMNFMLDTFVANELYISVDAGWGYSYQKPVLRFPNISISYARWITPVYFMEMAETCEEISLREVTKITDQDLNRFLKAWLAGSNDTLKKAFIYRKPDRCLHFGFPAAPFKREIVFDDVKFTQVGNEKNGLGVYRIEVVVSRSDGKRAKVIVYQWEDIRDEFRFTVLE